MPAGCVCPAALIVAARVCFSCISQGRRRRRPSHARRARAVDPGESIAVFIGLIVNAMQREHAKAEEAEREAGREIVHEETLPLPRELVRLRDQIAALRRDLAARARS